MCEDSFPRCELEKWNPAVEALVGPFETRVRFTAISEHRNSKKQGTNSWSVKTSKVRSGTEKSQVYHVSKLRCSFPARVHRKLPATVSFPHLASSWDSRSRIAVSQPLLAEPGSHNEIWSQRAFGWGSQRIEELASGTHREAKSGVWGEKPLPRNPRASPKAEAGEDAGARASRLSQRPLPRTAPS